jgi:putative transposase
VAIVEQYGHRFCIDALEEAIKHNGAPENSNIDQESQFTSEDFTGVLKSSDIDIIMYGKRRWVDY